MSCVAYIFPGQGSQYVGMGRDLYENSRIAREFFEKADDILGFSLSKICFKGPEMELLQTKNTQLAIYLHSVILTKLLENHEVVMTAGHSLGEYSALVFAGALTFDDGLKLVRLRAELMQQAGEREKGTMAAIVGLSSEVLDDICQEASKVGVVQCANFNSRSQVVVSGSVAGVHKMMEIAKECGAKLVKELMVSGAFHSPLMETARVKFEEILAETPFTDARIPVYANVSASPVQSAFEISTLLSKQLTTAVQWDKSIRQMITDGAEIFVEVGPGKVLQGLVKRIDDIVRVRGVDTFDDLEKLVVA